MTPTERWEAMTPRERDAWVAEHIMGWLDVDDGKFMSKWKGYDKGTGNVQWDATDHSGIPAEGGVRDFLPTYTTDASADYLVLQKVRETWGHEQTKRFVEELTGIRWARSNVTLAFSLELFAEPGDYSLAAFLTLNPEPNA